MKSLNPSHPDCECEQCQEMFRRASAFQTECDELRKPYIFASRRFHNVSIFAPEAAAAHAELDQVWKDYQNKRQLAYEKYPIAHHA